MPPEKFGMQMTGLCKTGERTGTWISAKKNEARRSTFSLSPPKFQQNPFWRNKILLPYIFIHVRIIDMDCAAQISIISVSPEFAYFFLGLRHGPLSRKILCKLSVMYASIDEVTTETFSDLIQVSRYINIIYFILDTIVSNFDIIPFSLDIMVRFS